MKEARIAKIRKSIDNQLKEIRDIVEIKFSLFKNIQIYFLSRIYRSKKSKI